MPNFMRVCRMSGVELSHRPIEMRPGAVISRRSRPPPAAHQMARNDSRGSRDAALRPVAVLTRSGAVGPGRPAGPGGGLMPGRPGWAGRRCDAAPGMAGGWSRGARPAAGFRHRASCRVHTRSKRPRKCGELARCRRTYTMPENLHDAGELARCRRTYTMPGNLHGGGPARPRPGAYLCRRRCRSA